MSRSMFYPHRHSLGLREANWTTSGEPGRPAPDYRYCFPRATIDQPDSPDWPCSGPTRPQIITGGHVKLWFALGVSSLLRHAALSTVQLRSVLTWDGLSTANLSSFKQKNSSFWRGAQIRSRKQQRSLKKVKKMSTSLYNWWTFMTFELP